MSRMNKATMLDGVEYNNARLIGNNTVEYTHGNQRVIRHFRTDILTINIETHDIMFNTDGHRTLTTRKRLNDHQNIMNIWQKNRIWYCQPLVSKTKEERKSHTIVFNDGMVFSKKPRPNSIPFGYGFITGAGSEPDKKLIKKIKAYTKKFIAALPVDPPDGGDCWICIAERSSRNEYTDVDVSHLISHIEEDYFVPTLLLNAMERKGMTQLWQATAFGHNTFLRLDDSYVQQSFKRALYEYLYAHIIDRECSQRLTTDGFAV
jgi:hypothetical protein